MEDGNIHTSNQRAQQSVPMMVIPVQPVHRTTATHEKLGLLMDIFSLSASKAIKDVLNSKMF